MRPAGVGPMDRLAVVPQRFLREPFRIAHGFGALSPRVTIRMEGHALDAKTLDALPKLRGAIRSAHLRQIGKERAAAGEGFQDCLDLRAEMQPRDALGLAPEETDGVLLPIDVLRDKCGQIGLRGTEMPGHLVKRPAFGIALPGDDSLMFLKCDGALLLENWLRPLLPRQDGFGQPAHVEGEVVQAAQVHVGADRAGAEHFEQMLGACVEQRLVADQVEGMIFHRRHMTGVSVAVLGGRRLIHHNLPGARGGGFVAGTQVGDRQLLIKHRLAQGFILGVEQRGCFRFVPRAEAELFVRLRVFVVEGAAAPEEDVPWFHALPFVVGNVNQFGDLSLVSSAWVGSGLNVGSGALGIICRCLLTVSLTISGCRLRKLLR